MLNLEELRNATNGTIINGEGNTMPLNYVIDSRDIRKGDFFIPLIGEKTDGHNYIIDCVRKEITGFFINSDFKEKETVIKEAIKTNKDICILEVNCTQEALYDAGKYNRNKHIDIPVIAVTGSVGKTSTREMIASVLKTEYEVLVTKRNYNSIIGSPIMALQMDNQDVCIFEIGTDHKGEIAKLTDLLMPDIGVVTMIGTAHIEMFGSIQEIFKEKMSICKNMDMKNMLIVNGDDEFLKEVDNSAKCDVVKYTMNNVRNLHESEKGIEFYTNVYDKEYKFVINEIGIHNVKNALCAIKVAENFKVSCNNIIKGISNYKNFSRRLERIEIENDIIIIDDTYNASIDSMISGLKTVGNIKNKRKIAVLGDMLELGEFSKDLHYKVGKCFEEIDFDILYTYGKEAVNIQEGAKSSFKQENNIHFLDKTSLIEKIKTEKKRGDVIYFKASNGMKFFEIIENIR